MLELQYKLGFNKANQKGGRVSVEGSTEGSVSFITQIILCGKILYISLLLVDRSVYYQK